MYEGPSKSNVINAFSMDSTLTISMCDTSLKRTFDCGYSDV